ncbi:MAG: accessory gene regulator ArgB-like protein [Thermincolia bacterium]
MEKVVKKSVAYLVKELNLSGEQEIILTYAARIFVSSVMGYAVIILFSVVLGVLPYTLAAAVTASVLRIFSGGAHASSPFNCTFIGAVVFASLGLAGKYTSGWVGTYLPLLTLLVWLTAVAAIIRYAPADTPGKPINTKMQRQRLRIISLTVVFLWGLLALVSLAGPLEIEREIIYTSTLGLLWQAFSLTPPGYALAGTLDDCFNKVMSFRKDVEYHA